MPVPAIKITKEDFFVFVILDGLTTLLGKLNVFNGFRSVACQAVGTRQAFISISPVKVLHQVCDLFR